jgi:hypothetical protein
METKAISSTAREKQQLRDEAVKSGSCIRTVVAIKPCVPSTRSVLTYDQVTQTFSIHGAAKPFKDCTRAAKVFDGQFTIGDVHNYIAQHNPIEALKNGRKLVMLASGYTGAGKTRLMLRGDKGQDPLMLSIPRHYGGEMQSNSVSVGMFVLEVYNNRAMRFSHAGSSHPRAPAMERIWRSIYPAIPCISATSAPIALYARCATGWLRSAPARRQTAMLTAPHVPTL